MAGKTRCTKEFQAKALRLPGEPCANPASETKNAAVSGSGLSAALIRGFLTECGCRAFKRRPACQVPTRHEAPA